MSPPLSWSQRGCCTSLLCTHIPGRKKEEETKGFLLAGLYFVYLEGLISLENSRLYFLVQNYVTMSPLARKENKDGIF